MYINDCRIMISIQIDGKKGREGGQSIDMDCVFASISAEDQ